MVVVTKTFLSLTLGFCGCGCFGYHSPSLVILLSVPTAAVSKASEPEGEARCLARFLNLRRLLS